MPKFSSTQATRKFLEERGIPSSLIADAEWYNPWARKRKDLFGIADLVVVDPSKPRPRLVQCTVGTGNGSKRCQKIDGLSHTPQLTRVFDVEVWSWRKLKHEGWCPQVKVLREGGWRLDPQE